MITGGVPLPDRLEDGHGAIHALMLTSIQQGAGTERGKDGNDDDDDDNDNEEKGNTHNGYVNHNGHIAYNGYMPADLSLSLPSSFDPVACRAPLETIAAIRRAFVRVSTMDRASREAQRVWRGRVGRRSVFLAKITGQYKRERQGNQVYTFWLAEQKRYQEHLRRQRELQRREAEKERIAGDLEKTLRFGWVKIPERYSYDYYWHKSTKETTYDRPTYSYDEFVAARTVQNCLRARRARHLLAELRQYVDNEARIARLKSATTKLVRFAEMEGGVVESVEREGERHGNDGEEFGTHHAPHRRVDHITAYRAMVKKMEDAAPRLQKVSWSPSKARAKGRLCRECKKQKADRFCTDCTKLFCFACFAMTHKAKSRGAALRAHRVEMLHAVDPSTSVDTPICTECTKKIATRYCLGCERDQRFLCGVCFNVKHACGDCSKALGVHFCATCSQQYCHGCFDRFHAKGGRKGHIKLRSRHRYIGFASATATATAVAASGADEQAGGGAKEQHKEKGGNKLFVCSECAPETISIASCRCLDCEDFFCELCFASLHSRPITTGHRKELLCTVPGPPPAPVVVVKEIEVEDPPSFVVKKDGPEGRALAALKSRKQNDKGSSHKKEAGRRRGEDGKKQRVAEESSTRGSGKDNAKVKEKECEGKSGSEAKDGKKECEGSPLSSSSLAPAHHNTKIAVTLGLLPPSNTGGMEVKAYRVFLRQSSNPDSEDPKQFYPTAVRDLEKTSEQALQRIHRSEAKLRNAKRIVDAATETTADFDWIERAKADLRTTKQHLIKLRAETRAIKNKLEHARSTMFREVMFAECKGELGIDLTLPVGSVTRGKVYQVCIRVENSVGVSVLGKAVTFKCTE